ncbi:MAG: GNAT family N-acetyltransferase [Aurantimonas endophytica]|uniref:L-amino acid N-acyltransferase YncA n=1 Tax=Aurantimonas endophytica TaxID=1522175 RepID=A0A7W6HB09_9HYPH|nr:GNAT family N-acetyltransferase [Aurantimonas endophytica]MBB4001899.1 L-amino acid N-acyltransferase YncA [Aurantimonas endophytica]MCO6402466.1 GNAT family N-acetyltransferase [Aurantimonas endophytica]
MSVPSEVRHQSSGLVLRDLELRDVDRVAEFEAAIAQRSFAEEAVTDLAHYRKKLGKLVKYGGDWTKVAERDGEIVGWAWVAPRQNFITGDEYADFRSFYVDGERAGSAASVMLLRAVLAHARAAGYTRIVGRTATSNEAMRALYRLAGFEEKHVVYELAIGGDGRELG